ncbi:hypothetical protein BSPWISOXPB_9251 [uncultured Gammaproteobacteria bacterium]|nr:hypothetical protein BSPWISOXPB_9251 [uncultured Gammaproteobacteria bacterium]
MFLRLKTRAMFIRLTTNQDFNKDVDVIFSITGGGINLILSN